MAVPEEMGERMRLALLLLLTAGLLPGTTYYVTVAGLGGEEDYEQRFESLAQQLDKLLRQGGGEARVETLYGDEARREAVTAVLERIARETEPGDSLALMLIGHGSFDGYEYKVNLPGPDLTALELSSLLDRIPASSQMVANLTSASGGSLEALSKPNRTVITATKSGRERIAVVFSRYWVEALQDAAADTDKNGVISALEAFEYADRKTQEFYVAQKRLATEHALLEDTGEGEGVRSPSPENGKGLEARNFPVLRIGPTQLASQDPAKRALLERKEELERKIDQLKYEKAAMPIEEYRSRLTTLLLDLAKTQKALDEE